MMREPAFLRQDKDKWLEYERQIFNQDGLGEVDADRLAELYLQLTNDLAYARTFYPQSKIIKYLNGLAAKTHITIYKNKKEKKERFLTFWRDELPLLYADAHKYMLYAGLIFTLSFFIGLLSVLREEDFARVILGDAYVNMTIENIRNGEPLGVYGSMPQAEMFLFIMFNNVWVMLQIFAAGLFFGVGTITGIPGRVAGIMYTGIMVGAFLGFFHQYNLFWEALPIVYIHGTLELWTVVVAGAAGMGMGYKILFPGTFSRIQALQQGANHGIKMMMGTVPVIIIAAFLESFVTRLTQMHIGIKLGIILFSLLFIVFYYIWYPIRVKRKTNT